MNPKTAPQLMSVCRHLYQALEIINLVDEQDYLLIVHKAQEKHEQIKNVIDNANRGSLFLLLFFSLELIGELTDELANEVSPSKQT